MLISGHNLEPVKVYSSNIAQWDCIAINKEKKFSFIESMSVSPKTAKIAICGAVNYSNLFDANTVCISA